MRGYLARDLKKIMLTAVWRVDGIGAERQEWKHVRDPSRGPDERWWWLPLGLQ